MLQLLTKHPRVQSRRVEIDDIPRLLAIKDEWADLCHQPAGRVGSALAIAHVQIEAADPLRAFMLADGKLVVNPCILDRDVPFLHMEGCMTWPFRDSKKVKRHGLIQVSYETIDGDKLAQTVEWKEGLEACIFQHEIDHFNLNTLYKI